MQGETSTRLGFTDYFRVELACAKLLGSVLLLAPVPARLKEWAYAAFAITRLCAHRPPLDRRRPAEAWGWAAGTGRALRILVLCGVASRARASAGPLEDEQRVANQDPKNPAQMKASTGSPLTDVSAEYRFHVDDGRSVQTSRCRTCSRRPSTGVMTTSCRPVGFGRSEDRVLNTPSCFLARSPLGCTTEIVSPRSVSQYSKHWDLQVPRRSIETAGTGVRRRTRSYAPRRGAAASSLLARGGRLHR